MPTTRLYLNITNHCNVCCPFCCMYSSPDKQTFMAYDKFIEILSSHKDYELQIEGGEPFLHPEFNKFLKFALETGECKKIIILTNGLNMRKDIQEIINVRDKNKKILEVKVSVNSFLLRQRERFLFEIALAGQNIQFIPNMSIKLNVRKAYDEEDFLEKELAEYDLLNRVNNIFKFNGYGRLKDDARYSGICIRQNIDTWKIFASDGRCFGQDLEARSEYENELD